MLDAMTVRLLLLLSAALLVGAAAPPPEAASTTTTGLAQTRALLAALQKTSPTIAAASGAATARALIAQLDALKPSSPTAAAGRATPVSMPPALVTSIARLLADVSTQPQLKALMGSGGPLASMAAPYSRAERCKAIRRMAVSQAVKDCYCSATKPQPWPRCDALLHLELQAAAAQLDTVAKQMKASTTNPTAKKSQPARRLMQNKCGDAKALDLIMAATTTGCTSLSCSWAVDSIPLSIKLNLNGCAPTMGLSDTNGDGLVGAGDTVKYCQKGSCTSLPFATAAKWETAASYFNAGLAGTVDVCLGFPALTAQLAKFGWVNNGTWCPQTGVTAAWYPLKRQVGLGGRVSAVILSQGVWADLSGSINIANGKTNPACTTFGPLDATWRCAPFCTWGAGQGQLTANLGWKILWMTNTVAKALLNTPVVC